MIWNLGERILDFESKVQVMGILNVTPDSFYDGGQTMEAAAAVDRALEMKDQGADIIDVGGESTRPAMYGGGAQVPLDEECRRVVPVIDELRRVSSVPVSIDTTKAEVARRCLDAGADIVNDTSALRDDEQMVEVVAESCAPVILMHRRGTIATMQDDTEYIDLVGEIRSFLAERIQFCIASGIDSERIAIDPGVGFGKSAAGNFELIRKLRSFTELECPVLVGASRKSFIWRTLGLSVGESLEGSLAVAALVVERGARILRVHDVQATVRVVRIVEAACPVSRRNSIGALSC